MTNTEPIFVGPKKVADYAVRSTPTFLAMLKTRGYDTVLRYVNGFAAHWKVLTIAERELIWSLGFSIMLVFETHAGRPLQGAGAGRIDGRLAALDAKRLGYPASCVMWVAFDIDVTNANRSVCIAYLHAFRTAYRAEMGAPALVGQYGDWDMIEALGDTLDGHWQPNAKFWSSVWDVVLGRWRYRGTHPLAHLQQYKTIDGYDPNDVRRPGLRAWVKQTAPRPEPELPIPQPEDDDMGILYKVDDGDTAEFVASGGVARWVRNGKNREALQGISGQCRPGEPNLCARSFLAELVLVGPAPTYPPGYTGPRTTHADFGH